MTLSIERDGPVTTLVRDRREARNAMDPESAEALTAALLAFDADPAQSVAVLWGAGGAFCAGFDLKYAASLLGRERPLGVLDFPAGDGPVPRGPMGPTRLMLSKPVIAAIAGPAVAGGMELALWCDLRVMEESAYMGVYCRRWGVPLIDGGTQRLPRVVGLGRALDLILTGRIVGAAEALEMGMLTEVVEQGRHLERALEIAEGLARFPQQTMLADRRAALEGFGLALDEALALEAQAGPAVFADAVAGAARFAGGEGRGGSGAGV